MTRSTLIGGLMVIALTTACDSNPLAIDEAVLADDELSSAITTESGSNDLHGRSDSADRSNSLFSRLAAAIPGFGGLYRTERCVVALVLTADADAQEAARIVHAAIEPLVVRTCPDGIRVEPVRGTYTWVELRRMLLASRPLNRIPGVGGARIAFEHNSLIILVSGRPVARVVLAALPGLGIPEDAVMFQLGRKLERP